MLTDEDLAYMRQVQSDHRPTAATLFRRVAARAADGGTVDAFSDVGHPVQVRIDGSPDRVPAVVAERMEGASPVKITMDQARDVRSGDQVRVNATEVYALVSEGDPDRWATAQVVWARRTAWPTR